jgi:hypothetical membrane protein
MSMTSDEAARSTSDGLLRRLARRDGLAWGGVVGPAVFVADWAVLGAVRSGYSPIDEAISRLAELGATTRPEMTGGFVVYGTGLITYGLARRQRSPGPAWALAVATGVATLGVAAFPLGRPLSGTVHAVFAVAGYATLAALPIAASAALAGAGQRHLSRLSVLAGTTTGALLLASALGAPAHGLTQRLGLTVGDAWVALSAAAMLGGTAPSPGANVVAVGTQQRPGRGRAQ